MLESDKKKQYSNSKTFFLTVNHCMYKDTYSLFTVDNYNLPVLQRFNGYVSTDNPDTALTEAYILYRNGYRCKNGAAGTIADVQRASDNNKKQISHL